MLFRSLDHIHTQLPDKDGKEMVPISYQRLLMGCRFPDGSFALAMLVDRTNNIIIEGLSKEQAGLMPAEFVMDIQSL